MKSLVICKTCGYIMAESRLGDICPACGVPAKLFEPYKSRVSEARRRVIALDTHPVVVHAPQGMAFVMMVLSLGALILSGTLAEHVTSTVVVLSVVLPVTVVGGIATGLLDGKVRFKKLTTPALVKKIVLGSLFLVFSGAAAIITIVAGSATPSYMLLMLLLSFGCFVCSTFLGLIGVKLVGAAFPG